MRRTGILHPELARCLATIGHGDTLVLADAGLRIPRGCRAIDLRLVDGVPDMPAVLGAVVNDAVFESAIVATEWAEWNPRRRADVLAALPVPVPVSERPHDELIADTGDRVHTYVRTAECTAFASIWLIGGVSYFDDAVEVRRRAQHIETTQQGDAQ